MESCEEPISGYKTLGDFTKDGYKILMEGIKHANNLPAGRDRNFYATFDSFTTALNAESQQLMEGITAVLKKNDVRTKMMNQSMDKKTEILIDANDLILERVANNIDEMNGIRKTVLNEPVFLQTVSMQVPININGSWNRSTNVNAIASMEHSEVASQRRKEVTVRLLAAENIVRPQKLFKDKIDNRNDCPWEPRIKDKPNSLKPLAIFVEETEVGKQFSHPYEYELDRFTPSDDFLTKIQPITPKLVEDTPLLEIDDPSQLPELVEELRKQKIIAVDLEHHSYRSFMGITCLMQISTFDKDYLIDTLALRNDLWILNEIFTRPDIVKVFHGADSDILWLQRDLSLYVVNMFDTYFAAKHLEYSGLSLAYLLRRFCNFVPNKQFQLADWRIRPLPNELKNYAREDTHYLIYIYQNVRNELIDKANGNNNLLKAVIDYSTILCKKRYYKPRWHENVHLEFYSRCRRTFDNRQLFALKEIYKWRDEIARVEDESAGYVLPNNMLLEIAERLPKEMQGILACCRPVPPLVRSNLLEIHKIILKALEKPFEEPILKEDTRARGSTKRHTKLNVDSPLHCPHDMTRNEEFRDDLPTLINSTNQEIIKSILSAEILLEQHKSACSVFDLRRSDIQTLNEAQEKLNKFKSNIRFLGPFERYKLVRPFIQAREEKLKAEEMLRQEEARKKEAVKKENVTLLEATQIESDFRTDEDRIESIREHFLQLARQTISKPSSPKKSLLELGGSKKRKREDNILQGNLHPQYVLPEHHLHTPVPNLQITLHSENRSELKKKGGYADATDCRKRKLSDGPNDPGPSKIPKLSRREQNRMKMQKRKEKKALAIMRNNESSEDAKTQAGISAGQATQKKGTPKNQRRPRDGRGGKRGRGNNNNKNRQSRGETNQQAVNRAEEFKSYDYSMVDFRQFQGGAGGTPKKQGFKTKFRGRGKPNKRGGQQNKAMSFGRGKSR